MTHPTGPAAVPPESARQPRTVWRLRRRAKLLAWRAMMGAAYAAGGLLITLALQWFFAWL
ncbi:hypothetical protein PV735_46650 [Streptomyces turgidiscabies]|uniref:Uncharacterized protein n=1 Tax=Streptomyces turgidiscabies (strain Car8) TaxID=698760 RepID=L7FE78_STRT8|nr:hypothetical protein [Streptomyces turgidiscabies]ELP69514.1 hypothetical protein STRTUCAR8_00022 [Streptomyces turgidiscabies Car8]MDX3500101.1 hypothetical protein [Streptomyces turgidiscabies]GAQ77182.1 hypothetical protein T45_08998 [Streptomyces turgidiscabies]